ncbi:Outer membrane porin protein 32 precursor [compost metagenome]
MRNAGGSARSDNDAQQVAIGYVYDFSRRTALYGTYARIRNEGQAAYNVSGGRAPLPGRSSSGLELGLRHSF